MLAVLSFIGLAAGIGLQAAARVPPANDRALIVSAALNSDLDYWRAVAFNGSPWPSTFPYSSSDTVTLTIGGKSVIVNRTTTIRKWDPNNLASGASPQDDFFQIQITIDNQSLTFYLASPL